MRLPIYLDHHATTPVDPRVLDDMLPYFTEVFGNAASIDHEYGFEGLNAVNIARQKVAKAIGAKAPEEIIFTSGATESDNLAVIGVAEKFKHKGKHIITSVTEHKAVLDTCKYLEALGWEISYLGVDRFGQINLENIKNSIRDDTVLISIMAANNEIGTLAPLKQIGAFAKENDILFHTDATQAVGYIPINVQDMNIDLLSLSGHKIYGPKGIGALFVRNSRPRIKLTEQIHGGGHERGMRSGTLNVPGIVGLGKAIEISTTNISQQSKNLAKLRDMLWFEISENLPGTELNGHPNNRLPQNLSLFLPRIESRSLIVQLKDHLAISTGSACATATVEPSHVLIALGYGEQRAYSSVRFGIGRTNTEEEIKYASRIFVEAVNRLQKL